MLSSGTDGLLVGSSLTQTGGSMVSSNSKAQSFCPTSQPGSAGSSVLSSDSLGTLKATTSTLKGEQPTMTTSSRGQASISQSESPSGSSILRGLSGSLASCSTCSVTSLPSGTASVGTSTSEASTSVDACSGVLGNQSIGTGTGSYSGPTSSRTTISTTMSSVILPL